MNTFRDKTGEFPLKAPFNFDFTSILLLFSTQVLSSSWDSMHHGLPVSSVRGILQERILEWVAIPFSKGSSQLRDQTQVSWICRQILYCLRHEGSPKIFYIFSISRASLLRHGAKCVKVFWSLSLECELSHLCLDNFNQGRTNTHKARRLVGVLRAVRTLLPNKLPPPWSANCG